jgi:hypothetical protein
LRKAELARERRDRPFVVAVAVGVHQDDRDGADAVFLRARELRAHRVKVDLALDRAVGAHALVHLDHALVEHVRLDDVPGEDFRPRLVADAQRVAEALGDEEQRALALTLEERIGGDRRSHLHGADARRCNRLAGLEAEELADPLDCRVAIGLGILRQQFVGDELAVRPAADHIGEGTAAIDPKIPNSRLAIHGLVTKPEVREDKARPARGEGHSRRG